MTNPPKMPADEEGPVFAEPGLAQAFALAVELAAVGAFTRTEWTAALAEELRLAAAAGAPDDGALPREAGGALSG
jgi:hypothetical protein